MGVIRVATEEDAKEILDIYRPYIEETAVSFETSVPTVEEMKERIRKYLTKHCWLVWEENGRVEGYAYASKHHNRTAYQWAVDVSIYINRDYQGKGLGKKLYTALFEILRAQGFYNAYACICLPHPRSVGIHESFGFVKNGHFNQVGYKLGRWWDIGWWELFLLNKETILREPMEPQTLTNLGSEKIARILSAIK